jgi:hypothetical protein
MLFGHNSNVLVGADTVHVQTEDHGVTHALIDTTVHWKGQVLHRRTNNYLDLLPLDAAKEEALKVRLDEQHRTVIEEIRSGSLKLVLQPSPTALPTSSKVIVMPAALKVELTNAKNWLAGKQVTLHLRVRDSAANAVSGVAVKASVEGAESVTEFAAKTEVDGTATISFEMPKLSGAEAALLIEAANPTAKGHLRFQLRAKPKA